LPDPEPETEAEGSEEAYGYDPVSPALSLASVLDHQRPGIADRRARRAGRRDDH
jgi:hypothetical protein